MKIYIAKDQESTYIFLNEPVFDEVEKYFYDGTENYTDLKKDIGLKLGECREVELNFCPDNFGYFFLGEQKCIK